MENPVTFSIAEPCHENWNGMTPEAQGRFCASCQRCVFDFTNKSKADLEKVYLQQGGDICGRVKASDLGSARPAIRGKMDLRRHGLKSVQLFALALMAAFTFLFSSPVQAQKEVVMGKIAYVAPSEVGGRVKWDSGEPAVGVQVQLLQNGTLVASTVTDDDGRYLLSTRRHGELQVVVQSGHWVREEKSVNLTEDRRAKADFLLQDRVVMGQIAVPLEIEQPTRDEKQPSEPDLVVPTSPETAPDTEAESARPMEINLNPDEALQLDGFELKVYPNPTTDKVNLVVEKAGNRALDISVIDLHGQVVYSGKWVAFLDRHKSIDLGGLASGVYLLHLHSGDQSLVRRVLKH